MQSKNLNPINILENNNKKEYDIIYKKAHKHLNNHKIIGCLLNILDDAYSNMIIFMDSVSNSNSLYLKMQELLKIFYKIKIINYNIFKIWSRYVYNLGDYVLDIIIYLENGQQVYMLKTIYNNDKENTLESYNNIQYYVTNEEIKYIAKLLNIYIYDNINTQIDEIETLYIGSLLSSDIEPIIKQ